MSTPIPLSEFILLADRDEELHRLREEVPRLEAEIEALTVERDNFRLEAEGHDSAFAEQYDLLRTELDDTEVKVENLLVQRERLAGQLHLAQSRMEELEYELAHVAAVPVQLDDKITDLTAFIAELREWLTLSRDEATDLRKRNSDQARKVTKLNEENRELREQRETLQLRLKVEQSEYHKRMDDLAREANKDHNAVLVELAAANSDRDRYKAKARRKILTPRFQFYVSETTADIITVLFVLIVFVILPGFYIATH